MDENNTNVELEEESLEMVDEPASKMTNDELTKAIQEQMEKLRRQSMLIGAQAMCQVILQKILAVTNKPGKISMRAYERLINDITNFCKTGISRQVNTNGTTSPVEENTESAEEENQ